MERGVKEVLTTFLGVRGFECIARGDKDSEDVTVEDLDQNKGGFEVKRTNTTDFMDKIKGQLGIN